MGDIMKKILILVLIVVIIICVGLNISSFFDFNAPDDITEFTNLFDYSNEAVINWNEKTHEFKYNHNISSIDNQDFENINIDIIFYNNGKQIGIESNKINKTEDGSFNLNFTKKLNSQPDAFYYNVTDLNWIYQ